MAKKTQTPPKSFEEALAELEQIHAEIEAGELGLE
jgi:exonuclease VII small subunit